MKTADIRRAFLEFFKEKGHAVVQSSSLVPHNDPTLLFTNAGMVQFKDVFLGRESRPYSRATSSQKCIRAGGKHNDLENVGYTARHHTFFEMLGNFSFGDYFKREAIQFAWSFLTEHLKIPKSKLWITVFQEDEETAKIWLDEIKVDPNRFSRCGEKDNFWSMGDTGPCGPCTEIYYDHGATVAGGPPGSKDEDGDRFIEIWNIVFMQFDRREDGTLLPLPKPSVDTGMGMERVAAVMQGVHSNYEIDLFQDLIRFIAELANTSSLENKSLRVIADHIRACAFLAAEGVIPSNEGRGYVFRRICRRAIRHGHKLGLGSPFFYKLVQPLIEAMGEAYPELKQQKAQIERVLEQEELQFARTLDQGMKILEQDLALVRDNTIPGNTLFRLYDTYGFPVDLTADIARERGLKVDMDGFNEAMARQRTRGREASQFQAEVSDRVEISQTTDFTGYETLEEESIVEALFKDGVPVNQLSSGESGFIILNHTPFYAESGGQVGDQGMLEWKGGKFRVDNTKKSQAAHLHYGEVILGVLQKEMLVQAKVDQLKRQRTALNHSATHLLHAALRKLLGAHVQQKGSLVEPDRLRFDFTHMKPMTENEKRSVERLVNAQIRANTPVQTDVMAADKALESGAMALFGEKYGDQVRVLRMGEEDFSVELCGGTHVGRTGDIGFLKIVSETGIAAGVRRIEALTGEGAEQYIERIQDQLMTASNILKCSPDVLDEKLGQLLTRGKQLEKENQALKVQRLSKGSESNEAKFKPQDIDGHKVLVAEVEGGDPKSLREMVDRLKNQYKSGVFALISVVDEKVILTIGVTRDCIDKGLDAGELAKIAARWVGGQGGGRPDLAQAGGNNPAGIPEILKGIPALVLERIRPKRELTF